MAEGGELSPAAPPYRPPPAARKAAARSAWSAQAESLAQQPPPSDPVRVTDEAGNRVCLTPPTEPARAVAGDDGAGPLCGAPAPQPSSAPAAPAESPPPLQPGAAPPGEDVIRLRAENGDASSLRMEGGGLVLEIEGGRVRPARRTVREVTFFRDTNRLHFACDEPEWNVVLAQRGAELRSLYARVNRACSTAGIPVVADTYQYVTTGPNSSPLLVAMGPRGDPYGAPDAWQPPPPATGPPDLSLTPLRVAPPPQYGPPPGYAPPPVAPGAGQGMWVPKGRARAPAPQRDLVSDIQDLLSELGVEQWPQGLRQMPLPRLRDYHTYLLQQKKLVAGSWGPPPPPVDARPMLCVGAVARYVGGGRYQGRREWRDGDVLDVGMVGVVADIDDGNNWPFLVHFDGLWPTRLGLRDLEPLATTAAEADLRLGCDGRARTAEEWALHLSHMTGDCDWDEATPWEPPPPRPQGRPTGPFVVDKQRMRFQQQEEGAEWGRGGRGRGGGWRGRARGA